MVTCPRCGKLVEETDVNGCFVPPGGRLVVPVRDGKPLRKYAKEADAYSRVSWGPGELPDGITLSSVYVDDFFGTRLITFTPIHITRADTFTMQHHTKGAERRFGPRKAGRAAKTVWERL